MYEWRAKIGTEASMIICAYVNLCILRMLEGMFYIDVINTRNFLCTTGAFRNGESMC